MKKITLLLFASFLVLSCSVNKYADTYYPFSDGVEFKIKYVNFSKYSDLGEDPNYQYIAGKEGRVLQTIFSLKNNTQEDKELNLNEFYLLDSKNQKYEPTAIVQSGKVGGMAQGQLDIKLKANKEKTFTMTFKPAINKNEKITGVLVNGKEHKLSPSS